MVYACIVYLYMLFTVCSMCEQEMYLQIDKGKTESDSQQTGLKMSCFPDVWAPISLSYFTATASLLLSILIFLGNSLIILAVVIDPWHKLRTPFSYFLVNLAVSDLVVGSIALPTAFVAHLSEAKGHVPEYQVKLIHLTYFISTTASVLSLAALCLDRYVAIRWPIRYRKSLRLSRCLVISALIWIFSASITMLYLKVGYIDYLMVFVHASIIITFAILVLTYRQVYKILRCQSVAMRDAQNDNAVQNNEALRKIKTEKKVTRAFLYILGLFICSYAPAILMIYILQFCTQCNCTLRHVFRDLQFVFVSANSAMNPFVCGIRLEAFRKSIKSIILCHKKKSKYEITMSGSGVQVKDKERAGTAETINQ